MTYPSTRIVYLTLLLVGWLHAGATAQTSVGWRTDGTGRYPKATPPVEWSKEQNVVWKTKMPGRSFASPVVVGERIFVVSDPAELLCIQASDGTILWQRSVAVADVFGKQKAEVIAEAWKKINDNRRTLEREYSDLRRKKPDAKQQIKKLRDGMEAIDLQITRFRKSNPVPGRNGSGNTAGTPVSDGKHIYVSFGSGIVAAFDMNGERRWIRFVEGSEIGFGHASSFALIDGKLIVHYHDLVALDAGSGKELWRTQAAARHASPIVARIGREPILVTPSGNIVRIRDGKIIATHSDLRLHECSPIIENGIVYAQAGKTSTFRLPSTVEEMDKLEPLWQVRTANGRRTPSPVFHNGLLYGVTTDGLLDVLEAKTGKAVYRERLDIGNIYSSITSAGDHLYITSTRGKTLVLASGRTFKVIATNELESCGSCPVFIGSRVYLRTHANLYCIGK